jgi:hypothetical protein
MEKEVSKELTLNMLHDRNCKSCAFHAWIIFAQLIDNNIKTTESSNGLCGASGKEVIDLNSVCEKWKKS